MGLLSVKRVVVVLMILWVGTLCYIWLPDFIPDFLHVRSLSKSSDADLKVKEGAFRAGLKGTNESAMKLGENSGINQSDDAVHVVIASDSNTIGGMIALINSILSNTKAIVMFHLITDSETSDHLGMWLMKTKLRIINYEVKIFPKSLVEGKIKVRGGRPELANPLNYARYYLPKLFPNILGRIVYIDDDCIVQGDIQELYQMKIKPGHLAAFSEDCLGMNRRITFMQNVYSDYFDLKNKHFKELDINPSACSFNTGVFVTDLADWRSHNVTQKLEYWLELNTREELYGNERGGGGSQPPMMIVFYNKYTPIEQLWHVKYLGWSPRTSYTPQFIRSAKLLHWNGRFKPWGRTAAFQELWDFYYIPDPTDKFHIIRKGIL